MSATMARLVWSVRSDSDEDMNTWCAAMDTDTWLGDSSPDNPSGMFGKVTCGEPIRRSLDSPAGHFVVQELGGRIIVTRYDTAADMDAAYEQLLAAYLRWDGMTLDGRVAE